MTLLSYAKVVGGCATGAIKNGDLRASGRVPSFLQGDNAPTILLPGVAGVCLMTEDAAAAKLRANLKRIKGKLTDVNQLISQYTQVKQEKLTLQGEVATVQEEVATLRQEKQAFQERLDALQRALEAQSAGAVMQQRNDALEADNRKLKADLTSEQRKNKDLEASTRRLRQAERERGTASSSATSATDDAAAPRLAALQAELQAMKSAKLQASGRVGIW